MNVLIGLFQVPWPSGTGETGSTGIGTWVETGSKGIGTWVGACIGACIGDWDRDNAETSRFWAVTPSISRSIFSDTLCPGKTRSF